MKKETHKLLKLKEKEYTAYCRDCNFSVIGETRNVIVKAKNHAKKHNHSVEYFIESGRVYKFLK